MITVTVTVLDNHSGECVFAQECFDGCVFEEAWLPADLPRRDSDVITKALCSKAIEVKRIYKLRLDVAKMISDVTTAIIMKIFKSKDTVCGCRVDKESYNG